MRIDGQGRPIGGQCPFRLAGRFQNHPKPGKSAEMPGVQRQHMADIGKRGAVVTPVEIGGCPLIPGFDKIGVMVYHRGKMFDRLIVIAKVHGIEATFQQKIHRRRAGFAPLDPDFGFDPPGFVFFGGQEAGEKSVKFPGILGPGGASQEYRQNCREDVIENGGPDPHKGKVNDPQQNASAAGVTKERRMSEMIDAAVKALAAKLSGGFEGVARFVIIGEGVIMLDAAGVRAGDAAADVTLTAEAEVFRALLEGRMNATTAFMTGKLAVDGSMGLAMKLGSVLG